MFRRCVSLLLVLGHLAGQLAAAPHSHAADTEAHRHGHRSLPHVHLSWLETANHSRGHFHGCDHCSTAGLADCTVPEEPTIVPYTGVGHDADVVYLHDAVPSGVANAASEGELVCGRLALAVDSVAGIPIHAGVNSNSLVLEHLSDNGASACALYLKLRTLRI